MSSVEPRRQPEPGGAAGRTAATAGGGPALSSAIAAAMRKADPAPVKATPGRTAATAPTATAATTHATSRRAGRRRGLAGDQPTSIPYGVEAATPITIPAALDAAQRGAPAADLRCAPPRGWCAHASDEQRLLGRELVVVERAGVVERRQALELLDVAWRRRPAVVGVLSPGSRFHTHVGD